MSGRVSSSRRRPIAVAPPSITLRAQTTVLRAATDWVQDDDRQNMFGSKHDAGPAVLLRVPGGPQSVFGAPK